MMAKIIRAKLIKENERVRALLYNSNLDSKSFHFQYEIDSSALLIAVLQHFMLQILPSAREVLINCQKVLKILSSVRVVCKHDKSAKKKLSSFVLLGKWVSGK